MAATETGERMRTYASSSEARLTRDETKLSLKTTEFWAMAGVIAAILIASAVSNSLTTSVPGRSSRQSRSAT